MDFSLVLACYREEGHLLRNVKAIHSYLSTTALRYEIIFVEDKSPDETLREVEKSRAFLEERGVSAPAIFHERNLGRGRSVQDGIMIAQGRVVAYLDVDLENLIDGLLPMYLKVNGGDCDVIVGKRLYKSREVRLLRWVLSAGYKMLVHRILDLPVSDTETGLKVFAREKILPVLYLMQNTAWFWDTEVVIRAADAGLRVAEHPVVFLHNPGKASTVLPFIDSLIYLKELIAFKRSQKRAGAALPAPGNIRAN